MVEPDRHAFFTEIRQRLSNQAHALRGSLTLAGEIDTDEAGLIPSDVRALFTPICLELGQLEDELGAVIACRGEGSTR